MTSALIGRTAPWLSLILFAACADLPPFERGVCGNGVVEPELGEDCDLFADEGLACGVPEDATKACRFTCVDGGAACPAGWACGGDGQCRFASGLFEGHAISGRFLGEVEHLSSGDFDGDGTKDLFALTQGALSVRFGGGQVPVAFDLPFPSVGAPAVADLDGDGRTDVVVPQYEGLVVFRGETDQTLHPVPSPFLVGDLNGLSMRVVPVLARNLAAEGLLLVVTTAERFCATLKAEIHACSGASGLALDVPLLAPRPGAKFGVAHDRFLDGDEVREFVFGVVEGEPRVYVIEVAPCSIEGSGCVDGARRLVPHPPIQLGPGLGAGVLNVVRTTGRVMLADHNGDGRRDLLIGVRYTGSLPPELVGNGEQPRDGVLISYASDLGFAAPVLELSFNWLALRNRDNGFDALGSSWPLAAGDLNQDGFADYVGSEAVFLSDGVGMLPISAPALDSWSEAVVADLNRDGLLDVAAAFDSLEGLEFLQGTGHPSMNSSLIGTRGKARVLRVGDFDGDLVSDLAFVDRIQAPGSDEETSPETRIKISFGNLQGPPEDPIDIGPLDGINEMVPAYLANGDLITDLLVSAASPSSGLTSMAVLTGTTRRRMFSTLAPPPDELSENGSQPDTNPTLGVRVGLFNSTNPAWDILAVRKKDQWLLSGAGDASFPAQGMSRIDLRTSCPSLSPPLDPTCAVVTTGRLRSTDTVDSVVAFENLKFCGSSEEGARLTVMRLDPAMGAEEVRCWSTSVSALAGGIPSQASLLDLDGKGSPELVVVYGAGEVARGRGREEASVIESPTAKSQSGLAVYWNLGGVDEGPPLTGVPPEPRGASDDEDPASFASSDVVGAGAYSEEGNVERDPAIGPAIGTGLVPGFLATSPIEGDVDPEAELLVLTTDGLFIMDFSGNPEVPLLKPVRWGTYGRRDRIHTTDLDGDGLLDIVIARGAEYEVLMSVPNTRAFGGLQ